MFALAERCHVFVSDDMVLFVVTRSATVHLVTGSAGCQEGRDHFRHNPFDWSAFRSQDYGYTRLKAYNKTHINIEQVSVDLGGKVIDAFWLVKNVTRNF